MKPNNSVPPPEIIEMAKSSPNEWIYQIDQSYRGSRNVPPEAVVGAWKVDSFGIISGEFLPNPNYKSKNPDDLQERVDEER